MSQAKFVVHPGWVVSVKDRQRHFVGFGELVALYRVPPKECVRYRESGWRAPTNAIHLYPRSDDNYALPGGAA